MFLQLCVVLRSTKLSFSSSPSLVPPDPRRAINFLFSPPSLSQPLVPSLGIGSLLSASSLAFSLRLALPLSLCRSPSPSLWLLHSLSLSFPHSRSFPLFICRSLSPVPSLSPPSYFALRRSLSLKLSPASSPLLRFLLWLISPRRPRQEPHVGSRPPFGPADLRDMPLAGRIGASAAKSELKKGGMMGNNTAYYTGRRRERIGEREGGKQVRQKQ